jgi:two-component system LytT family response regulator
MNKIRAFVVDDEPPARRRLLELLEREPDIEIAGAFAGGAEALEAMAREAPDLLFLDVQMPGIDGFELLDEVEPDRRPITVFVTAYDSYALKAFEVRALDYLLKPFSDERFEATLSRARERVRSREREALGEKVLSLVETPPPREEKPYVSRLVVKNRGQVRFLDVRDVEWIEASGVYVVIHEGGREHLVRESLTALEARLDPSRFARIHRSAIVSLDRVAELRLDDRGGCRVVLGDGTILPLSRRQRDALEARLRGEGGP